MTQHYVGTKIVEAWKQEKDGQPGYAVGVLKHSLKRRTLLLGISGTCLGISNAWLPSTPNWPIAS